MVDQRADLCRTDPVHARQFGVLRRFRVPCALGQFHEPAERLGGACELGCVPLTDVPDPEREQKPLQRDVP